MRQRIFGVGFLAAGALLLPATPAAAQGADADSTLAADCVAPLGGLPVVGGLFCPE